MFSMYSDVKLISYFVYSFNIVFIWLSVCIFFGLGWSKKQMYSNVYIIMLQV